MRASSCTYRSIWRRQLRHGRAGIRRTPPARGGRPRRGAPSCRGAALARGFVELRQQVESDVGRLVIARDRRRKVVAQRAEGGLARQRLAAAPPVASAAACMPASSPVAIDST